PMVARRRQEVTRTADSALAARVVRRGGVATLASWSGRRGAEEAQLMPDAGHDEYRGRPEGEYLIEDGYVDDYADGILPPDDVHPDAEDYYEEDAQLRLYRPG